MIVRLGAAFFVGSALETGNLQVALASRPRFLQKKARARRPCHNFFPSSLADGIFVG